MGQVEAVSVLGQKISIYDSCSAAVDIFIDEAKNSNSREKGRYICVCNVHMLVEASENSELADAMNNSYANIPDGRPVHYLASKYSGRAAAHLRGYDCLKRILEEGAGKDLKIGFYGSTTENIELIKRRVSTEYPRARVVYAESPAFVPKAEVLSHAEIQAIREAGVELLFVGLGCPKQEVWMSLNSEYVSCVMMGVGAAFDFFSGGKPHCPEVVSKLGFEWLFRLLSEPKRLFWRYAKTNTIFIFKLISGYRGAI